MRDRKRVTGQALPHVSRKQNDAHVLVHKLLADHGVAKSFVLEGVSPDPRAGNAAGTPEFRLAESRLLLMITAGSAARRPSPACHTL